MEEASSKDLKKTSVTVNMFNDKTPIQNGPNGCVIKQLVTFTLRLRTIPHKVTFEQKFQQSSDGSVYIPVPE